MACGWKLAGLRYDERRSRALARRALTGYGEAESFGSEVNSTYRIPQGFLNAGERIGRIRNPTRACPRMTVRTSEVDTVRWRLFKVREGPRRVRILGAQKASVSEVRRIEIGRSWRQRIASSTLLLPGYANGRGRGDRHPNQRSRRWHRRVAGPLSKVQRGGQRAAAGR